MCDPLPEHTPPRDHGPADAYLTTARRAEMAGASNDRATSDRSTTRRAVVGALGVGVITLLAGCSRSRVDGNVAVNETPLRLTHEYATQATYSGTRVLVEVVVKNAGETPILLEQRTPRVTCTFLNDAERTLFESSVELVNPLDAGESTTLEFPLTIDTAAVTRYVLEIEWVTSQD